MITWRDWALDVYYITGFFLSFSLVFFIYQVLYTSMISHIWYHHQIWNCLLPIKIDHNKPQLLMHSAKKIRISNDLRFQAISIWFIYFRKHKSNSPISQRYFPQRWAARTPQISSWVITTHCQLYSNISQMLLFTKHGGITASLALQNHWRYITDVSKYHNAGKLSMD